MLCLSPGHHGIIPLSPSQEQGRHQAGWEVLFEPPLPSSARRGCRHPRGTCSTSATPTLAPERGRMWPCHPQPADSSSGTPAPHPNYCWVSPKTLKSKEESCEEGHFSASFSLLFFFPPEKEVRKAEPSKPH